MSPSHGFLQALAIVLCVAALTTVLFQRLRQPVVLGYLLAGLIVGPHVPIPLVADRDTVETLSELGVILLMFSLGLEFNLEKVVRVGPTAGLTAIIQCSIMFWLGLVVGEAFGWTTLESLFLGAIVAISSTTIIAKAFDEQQVGGRLRELVVGVLVVEDLIAILLMAALTALSSGDGLSPGELARSSGRLAAFLGALVAVGMVVVPRALRAIVRLGRPETTLVASIGLCFASSLLAQELGYSVALGAFIAGSLVAESGEEGEVQRLVHPVRDMFAAIFFVSVGMLLDPALIARHGLAVAVLTAVVIVGKVASTSLGAFLTGHGIRTSVQAGMSLAQIGEFSFIIAGLGVALKVTGDFLYPIAVCVSALTTLSTPWLIRASGPAASLVDRKLPRPLQVFAALYGSWVERLRRAPGRESRGAVARRLVRLLLLDAALLAGLVIATSVSADGIAAFLARSLGSTQEAARVAVTVASVVLAAPLCLGILRIARRLGATLAAGALPEVAEGRLDLAAAPRRALVVTLQLAIVLLVGLPLLALTQPFLPGPQGAIALALLLVVLGVVFWRSAANLQGHVRAGAGMIVEALTAQARRGAPRAGAQAFAQVRQLLPGLGEPVPVQLDAASPAVGKTLAALDLRGLTGATVLAISRGEAAILVPAASETLAAGDVLALAGTEEAVAAARRILEGGDPEAATAASRSGRTSPR
jgi:CPA2 family monovalent cation:H+ antiporter-2